MRPRGPAATPVGPAQDRNLERGDAGTTSTGTRLVRSTFAVTDPRIISETDPSLAVAIRMPSNRFDSAYRTISRAGAPRLTGDAEYRSPARASSLPAGPTA